MIRLLALAGCLSCTVAWAATPDLVCQIRYASETQLVRQSVSADPYGSPTHAVDNRFAFKAVVIGTPERIDTITLSVYDLQVDNAPVIIHQATHLPPYDTRPELPALTGWNRVYSSVLGREFIYGCTLQAALPARAQP